MLGTGGVGGYFGGRLAKAGHDVSFVARGAHLDALKQNGLVVTSADGDFTVSPAQATDDTRDIGEVDYVLLAVKTWQLEQVIPTLKPLIGSGTAVVTTQNGVDAPQQVADAVGRDIVLPGAVEVIAYIDGPGRIRQLGGGKLTFAEWDSRPTDRVERLRAALAEAGLTAVVSTDVWAALWTKFLTLASIGAMGTVTDAPFGVMRSRPAIRQLVQDSMTEVLHVARAKGITLPDDVIQARMAFFDEMPDAATTSLQRDIGAGKPSELEAWTGAAVRIGQETGTPTPVNSLLYELISARIQASAGRRA